MTWTRHGECNHCGHCCTFIAREAIVRTEFEIGRDRSFYLARGFAPTVVDGEERFVLWAWLHAPCPQYSQPWRLTRHWNGKTVLAENEIATHGATGEALTFQTQQAALETALYLLNDHGEVGWTPEMTSGGCRIHESKPMTCITFPRVPVDVVGTPCSYWFERVEDDLSGRVTYAGGSGSPHPTSEEQLLEIES